jgi:hypothetical protein
MYPEEMIGLLPMGVLFDIIFLWGTEHTRLTGMEESPYILLSIALRENDLAFSKHSLRNWPKR